MRIAFLGMTHLGIVSALAAAEKGYQVLCFDKNKKLISSLQTGDIPFSEPRVAELLEKHKQALMFTSDIRKLTSEPLIYIAPDIPTDAYGKSDLLSIRTLIDLATPYLSQEALVVILSQVSPGFCRQLPFDKERLFYQVETLIFGQAIERALFPERIIVGNQDGKAPLPPLLKDYLSCFDCPILPMRYESAELTKIAINLFLVSSVTTTNTIADLSEKIGASWEEIRRALTLDKRIGPNAYLSPGLGIAGGNLERDMASFCSLAENFGANANLVKSWQRHSSYTAHWVIRRLHTKGFFRAQTNHIALLGLSYKKDTSSIKNSPAITLLPFLAASVVTAYDPVIKSLSDPRINIAKTAYEAADKADALLIMTPWDEFRTLSLKVIKEKMAGNLILDPFGVLPKKAVSAFFYERRGELTIKEAAWS